jgi:hypothetical protein
VNDPERDQDEQGHGRPGRMCTIAGFYRYAVEEELLWSRPGSGRPASTR